MTDQQKIEEIVEILCKYQSIPIKKRASEVRGLAEKIVQFFIKKYKYENDVNVDAVEKELKKLISESRAEIKFELDAKKFAETVIGISKVTLSDSGNGGSPPPNDPPQYLFDLLKQETEQLWQRSIMLLTIFAGIFAAYGQIILPIFSEVNKAYALTAQHHFFAALVALVGIIFSLIWIAVGKGAHYWYLKYYFVLENEYNKNHNPKEISYFNLPPIGVNDCLLSLHPGRYSLSRSQIAIGIVILFIWLAIFVTHTVQFVVNDGLGWIQKLIDWNQRWITLGGIALAFGIIYILISLKQEGDYDYPQKLQKKINGIAKKLKSQQKEEIKNLITEDSDIKKYFEDEEKLNKLVEYLYNKYCKREGFNG